MTNPRAPKTVESFGPEIFEALITGSQREIVLELPYKKAVMFRQRANSLRAAMQKSNHPQYKIVAQTTLRIIWGLEAGYAEIPERRNTQNVRSPANRIAPAKFIISPADSEFSEALRKAGVTIRPLSSVEPLKPSPPKEEAPLFNDILEQLMTEKPDATDK